ncbi:DUF3306 domain-containing protein [Roseibium porphyridii]|uniref:DUF3306 domain-containing protein n=1 Tax=Roseibium porphyridii TaxID=2866279 RepID=A0ABY8F6B6_9HYPH|nr:MULTISPECIES: DUF3306 domain-containing protein [Stappiaceae]QFT30311.1 hypothetical protein FIV00_07495 [Labrenzia sp. THAF82]WFE90959.1 DUF3306 domain-containing protein [Roseibium sp. KMA01]
MSQQDDGGSDFWSRRKAAVKAAEAAEREDLEAAQQAEVRAALEEKSDEEILEELGLPNPDDLAENDDFSKFLSAAVPERLRRRALRRLWTLNPVLANIDGLVDYGEDFTDAATVVENLQTVYQVGKGMFDKFAELAETETEATEVADGEQAELVEDAQSELQCEENIATQNDYLHDGKTSFQLTQGDSVVQSGEESVVSLDLQETGAGESQEEPRITRRKMRFDYT